MRFQLKRMPIGLDRGAALTIDDPEGTTLRVLRGRVWVTQEGSVDDVFLDAGSGHTFRDAGRVVISAEPVSNGAVSIVFDAPMSVVTREPIWQTLRRMATFRPAPRSIASAAWEGI